MKHWTFVIIPGGSKATRQISIPTSLISVGRFTLLCALVLGGYFLQDYLGLRDARSQVDKLHTENRSLKSEARALVNKLDTVREDLKKVEAYTNRLAELTTNQAQRIEQRTGIDKTLPKAPILVQDFEGEEIAKSGPFSVNLDRLTFRPAFFKLTDIGNQAANQAAQMEKVVNVLSEQKSLLSSVPSLLPVNGWVTSAFGFRSSPLSGEYAFHQGLDIAAPLGTPVIAPADGVVIFSGTRTGFGNFVMVAHGYGVVTRYGHNSKNAVRPGQKVQRGEIIAYVGHGGRSTGSHVHYEVWVHGHPVDPRKFVLGDAVALL